ncbi:unnamed protein product, partial [Amoebophrya sp. A25]
NGASEIIGSCTTGICLRDNSKSVGGRDSSESIQVDEQNDEGAEACGDIDPEHEMGGDHTGEEASADDKIEAPGSGEQESASGQDSRFSYTENSENKTLSRA